MTISATDSRFLRAANIPSYGVTGLFIEEEDNRAHGKDERIRVSDFYAGLEFYDRFMKALVGRMSVTSRLRPDVGSPTDQLLGIRGLMAYFGIPEIGIDCLGF